MEEDVVPDWFEENSFKGGKPVFEVFWFA